jgi:tetratricopeptide (TPR) repeat protein
VGRGFGGFSGIGIEMGIPKTKKNRVALGVVLLWMLHALSAMAGMSQDERKALFDKGVSLYNQKSYAESADVFRELQRDKLVPEYYFNIGECEYLRKRFDFAKEAFDTYLELLGENANPERKKYIEKIFEKITPVLGELEVDESPPFEVWVDDEHRATTPSDSPIIVTIGEHTIVLKKDGKTVFEAKVMVDSEEPTIVKINDAEETESEASSPQNDVPTQNHTPVGVSENIAVSTTGHKPVSGAPMKPLGLGMVATGGILIITGIITGSLVLSKANLLEEKCPDKAGCSESEKDLYNSARRLGTATTALLPVGCVLAATGIVFTIWGSKQKNHKESTSSYSSLKFNAFAAYSGTGLTVSGSF